MVNGREITEPRAIVAGDHIDLGDVRLRVVGATEHYEPAIPVTDAQRRASRLGLTIALVVVVLSGAVSGVIYYFSVAN